MDAWKDGNLYRAEDLTVSAYDHGFLYGLGFFETFVHTMEGVFVGISGAGDDFLRR